MLILEFEVLEAGSFLGVDGKFALSFELFDLSFLLVFFREEPQELFVVGRDFPFCMSFFFLVEAVRMGIDAGVESLSVAFLIGMVSFVSCWGVVVVTRLERLLLRRSVMIFCIFDWVFVEF